jgi:branched-chain amino acid transport system permease protein
VDLFGSVDALLQGAMLGGLYAMFAIGLSLLFGVMRLVNVAHGDLVLLCAFVGFALTDRFGWNPFAAMALVVPCAAVLGYALQHAVLRHTIRPDPLPSIVVTFGLSIVIQNLLLELFSADTRSIAAGGLEARSLALPGGLAIGWLPLLTFGAALAATAAFQALFGATALGRAFRATADDPETAALMGIDRLRVYSLATAIAIGVLGIAGVLHGMRTTIAPTDGPAQLIYAFEAVIIGGMGSFWGTFAGGLTLGVAQTVGFRLDPGWGILAGHAVFAAVLLLRPSGLFARVSPAR